MDDRELLLRQRDAGDLDVAVLGEIEAEPAPAGADVEHPLSRLERELGGDVALLGELRVLQRRDAVLEVGAGILQVVVEEERIEPPVEIVVVRGRCGAPALGGLNCRTRRVSRRSAGCQDHRPRRHDVPDVAEDHMQKVVDRATLDDQLAVDELLAELQVGIDGRRC